MGLRGVIYVCKEGAWLKEFGRYGFVYSQEFEIDTSTLWNCK